MLSLRRVAAEESRAVDAMSDRYQESGHLPGRRSQRGSALSRVPDYTATPGGIQAGMRVCKIRPHVVPAPYGSRPSICPVRAWHAWKEAAGLDGYAWRRLHSRWHTVMDSGCSPSPSATSSPARRARRLGLTITDAGPVGHGRRDSSPS